MKESNFNATAQKLIEAHGGYVVKTIVNNKAGVSDMLACINGRFCALEGKLKYNNMSELQKVHHILVVKAGGLSACVKIIADVHEVIHRAKTGFKQSVPFELESFEL